MAKKLYEESAVQAIADAIREKSGATTTFKIAGMAQAISALLSDSGALIIGAENLHDSSQDTADIYLYMGVETAYPGWSTTDYIPVNADTVYAAQITATNGAIKGQYCALYDSDKKYKGNFSGGFFSVTGGVCLFIGVDGYVRFSGETNQILKLSVFECTGSLEFASEQSEAAILSDDIPAEVALDILTGGGPAE